MNEDIEIKTARKCGVPFYANGDACMKPGVEFTWVRLADGTKAKYWYCAEHWDWHAAHSKIGAGEFEY